MTDTQVAAALAAARPVSYWLDQPDAPDPLPAPEPLPGPELQPAP